ncbi:7 transmembrane receptor (rhodopsin family)-like protein 11 [Dinothrombium tinctorium]|uniref:7 transmembrane receptor (Rhodopsin family)-like protein 11 n=1 Tax=Dinothrombium tinctorium TaxID=1965070 RepID=A0A3S3P8F5_9ACAR|nr:7 transmembrane receptor (rhodopsin family)-like protein 11 [Dinothrombium tinctorium]
MQNETIVDYECSSAIPRGAAIYGFIWSLLVIAIGIPGNLLTVIALVRCAPKLLKHATTKFVINLAIADLIFCTFNLPMTSIRFLTCSWPFGDILCQLYPFFFYGNVAVSLMTITCITIDRLIMIAFQDYYKKIYKPSIIWMMIVFCWLFSFGLMSLPLFRMWGRMGLDNDTFSCTILKENGCSPKKFLFLIGFLIPCLAIGVCYAIIWRKVRLQANNSLAANRKTSQRDIKLTKLIVVIFFVFLLCFAPNLVSNVLLTKKRQAFPMLKLLKIETIANRLPYLQVTASALSWFNACVNPLIYFLMNRQYRNAFQRLLKPTFASIVTSSMRSNAYNESTISSS